MKKILLFLGMFLMFSTSVFASGHLELERIDGVYSNQYDLENGNYYSYNQKKYIIDGRMVYCVEPGIDITTMDHNISYRLTDSGFSQDVINKISLIGHFGYDYPGHGTDRYFLAAQELIWETIGRNEVYFTTGINDTGDMINIDYEKNEIMSLVNKYMLKPSFDSTSVTGIYGDQIVLVDKNNVISDYNIGFSSDGISIDGNKLIVDLNTIGDKQILFRKKMYDNQSSVFYYAPNSQDFMFLRAETNFISTVNVNSYVPVSKVKIVKNGLVLDGVDENNNFIYQEKGLSGVKFGIYSSDEIRYGNKFYFQKDQLIQELVTDNGVALSMDLPNGNYYIKELETLDEFVLDDNVTHFSLENYKEDTYTYTMEFHNDRKNVFINLEKHGEFLDEIIDNGGSYVELPLSGVKFGLFSNSDIYNVDGNLVLSKDSLIKTFVTDERGIINEQLDIPFGDYYIKEIETRTGYNSDSFVYEFSVSKSSSNDINIIVPGPIVNRIKKGKLVINKVDEDGNKLDGACFKFYNSLNALVYEGCTSDGSLILDNLAYGNYHFYEVSAPDGYLVSDEVYEASINGDDVVQIDVINSTMPTTSDIYAFPRIVAFIGLGLGLLVLSSAIIYDKANKDN